MHTLYFTRHGETVWNVENKICGMTDSPLTERGRQQARKLGEAVKASGVHIDEILYSPLSRAADTAMAIAKATGLPIEFFKLAPRGVSRRIYGMVMGYMNVDSNTENHIMRLEKPYYFEGKQYTEIDLNGVADLNSLNESAAENRLTRAGFMVTDTSYNYLYACILAGMATGLPEEFFTGLPLYEVLKIKNAVNDAGFFE